MIIQPPILWMKTGFLGCFVDILAGLLMIMLNVTTQEGRVSQKMKTDDHLKLSNTIAYVALRLLTETVMKKCKAGEIFVFSDLEIFVPLSPIISVVERKAVGAGTFGCAWIYEHLVYLKASTSDV